MDAIVSDISAFRYWRIPPLVRLLVSAPEDDALLQSIVSEEELTRLRQGCAQLASRASIVRTVLLATELCGSFSVYEAPACVREVLQTLVNEKRLPKLDGWSPCLDSEGQITNLWTRRPLVSRDGLLKVAEEASCRNGRARLKEAADLMVPGAASPFEAQTGVILGFSRQRGGEGHTGFSHNRRIALSREARALARRASCYCDF